MRRWWGIRGHDREVSRSMLSLVLVGALALAVGATGWIPALIGTDSGVRSVEPGRLIVDPEARGVITLGEGYTVSLFSSGFRYAKDDRTMAETVTQGSPVVGVLGSVREDTETIRATLARLHVTDLAIRPGTVTWTGELSGVIDGRTEVRPVRWEVRLDGQRIITTVAVHGVDGVVLPLDWRPAVTGVPPVLPARNLRLKAWWLAPGNPDAPAFDWVLGTRVTIGPDVPRALDLTVDGRIDAHVWAPTVTMTLTGLPADRARLAS